MSIVIGIDVGGTYTKVVALSRSGEIVHRSRLPTPEAREDGWPGAVRGELEKIERKCGCAQAVGVACPGLVRRHDDAVYWMKGRLSFVEGLHWTEVLHRPARVPVMNDAHAALKGETWLGAGRDCNDLVMLTLGTGIGGAILSNGRVLTGSTGRAGHLGHIALNVSGEKDIANTPGSLEDAIGDHTVPRRSRGRFSTTAELVAAHLNGDAFATTVWETSIQSLAAALASIINVVDPERIILGGGVARAGDALLSPLRRFMNEYEWRPDDKPVEIVPAALGDEAGAIGAAKHAIECHDSSTAVSR